MFARVLATIPGQTDELIRLISLGQYFRLQFPNFSSFSLHLLHGYEFYHVIHHLFLSISITMCVNELIELSKSIFEINTIDSSE